MMTERNSQQSPNLADSNLGDASPRRKAYLMRSSTLQQMPNSSTLQFNPSPLMTNTESIFFQKIDTETISPSKNYTPYLASPNRLLFAAQKISDGSEGLPSGLLTANLAQVDSYEYDDGIDELNENESDSVSYKCLRDKHYFTQTAKRSLLYVPPAHKHALKTKTGSSRSIRGILPTTAASTEKKLLDLSNASIMDGLHHSRNVSFRIGVNGKIRRMVGSPVSVNSRLCGEETFHNFQSLYELYQSQEDSIFLDTGILERILEFLDPADVVHMSRITYSYRNEKVFKKVFHKRLYVFFGKGLEKKEQVLFWNSLIHFRQKKTDHPFAYTQHFARKCRYLKEIKKDVDRTLPEYDKFATEEGKADLLRLLVATSNTVKDMGYMQGLNSIAGMFLFYLKEEESFWILLYFMEKMKFKNFLKEDFNTINTLIYQLDLFLEHYLPELTEHFNTKNTKASYFVTTWFLTLFSYNLNVANTIKVWNFLCLRGSAFLIQFTLAIFDKYKQSIMTMDIDEVGYFLKCELRELSDHESGLFERAINFKVSKRLLKEAEIQFNYGKPQMQIVTDLYGKQEWVGGKDINSESFRKLHLDLPHIKPAKATSTKEIIDSFLNTLTVELPGSIHNMFKKMDGKLSRKNSENQINMSRILPDRMDTEGAEEDKKQGRLSTLPDAEYITKMKSNPTPLPSILRKERRRNSKSVSKSPAEVQINLHNESNEDSFTIHSGDKIKFNLPKLQLHRRGQSSAATLGFKSTQSCRPLESDRVKSKFALEGSVRTRTRIPDEGEEALTPPSDAHDGFFNWSIPQNVFDALKEGTEKQKAKAMTHRGRISTTRGHS